MRDPQPIEIEAAEVEAALGALGLFSAHGFLGGEVFVVHGLLAGLVVLLDPSAGDGPRRRLLLRIALVGLAVLPAAVLALRGALAGRVPRALLERWWFSAPIALGLLLLAGGSIRVAVRRFGLTSGDLELRDAVVLGVIAALECVHTAMDEGIEPSSPIEIVATSEEGLSELKARILAVADNRQSPGFPLAFGRAVAGFRQDGAFQKRPRRRKKQRAGASAPPSGRRWAMAAASITATRRSAGARAARSGRG